MLSSLLTLTGKIKVKRKKEFESCGHVCYGSTSHGGKRKLTVNTLISALFYVSYRSMVNSIVNVELKHFPSIFQNKKNIINTDTCFEITDNYTLELNQVYFFVQKGEKRCLVAFSISLKSVAYNNRLRSRTLINEKKTVLF